MKQIQEYDVTKIILVPKPPSRPSLAIKEFELLCKDQPANKGLMGSYKSASSLGMRSKSISNHSFLQKLKRKFGLSLVTEYLCKRGMVNIQKMISHKDKSCSCEGQ